MHLPAEIRNRIYEYALGHKVIHISVRDCPATDTGRWSYQEYYRSRAKGNRRKYLRFTHAVCRLPFEEEDIAHRISRELTGFEDNGPRPYHERHKKCYCQLAALKNNWLRECDEVLPSPTFDFGLDAGLAVSLLRTCNQIHKEAALIPYATNTFAFHEGCALDLFVSRCLPRPQREEIQSLQIDGKGSLVEIQAMTSADHIERFVGFVNRPEPPGVVISTPPMLKSLGSLHVSFVWGPHCWLNPAGVGAFTQLHLSEIKVIISTSPTVNPSQSKQQRIEAAELVERKLRNGSFPVTYKGNLNGWT